MNGERDSTGGPLLILSGATLCNGVNQSVCQESTAAARQRAAGLAIARQLALLGIGIAVMGPPGAGKSTLVGAAKHYLGALSTDLEKLEYMDPAVRARAFARTAAIERGRMHVFGLTAGWFASRTRNHTIVRGDIYRDLPRALIRVMLIPDDAEYRKRWGVRQRFVHTATTPYHVRGIVFNISEAVSLYSDIVFTSYDSCVEQSILDMIGAVKQWLCDSQATAHGDSVMRARLVQVVQHGHCHFDRCHPEISDGREAALVHQPAVGGRRLEASLPVVPKTPSTKQARREKPGRTVLDVGAHFKVLESARMRKSPVDSSEGVPVSLRPQANQTTVVLMGHSPRRRPNYRRILKTLQRMSALLDRIIFVWNNQVEPSPIEAGNTSSYKIPIVHVRPAHNSMNNRYNVSPLVRTPSVLIIDDDVMYAPTAVQRLLVSFSLLHQRHGQSSGIVGFAIDGRYVNPDGTYKFSASPRGCSLPNMIIAKTLLLASSHLIAYMADASLLAAVDKGACAGCDDIALNALVLNSTNRTVTAVPSLLRGERHRLPEPGSLSTKSNWLARRSACVRWLVRHFGWTEWPQACA